MNERLGDRRFKCLYIFVFGYSCQFYHFLKLLNIGTSHQQWSTNDQLGYNTSNTPYISSLAIKLRPKQHLRWPIPSRRNILRQYQTSILFMSQGAYETKITKFNLTGRIDQYVGWFQIPVDQLCRMQIFQPFENLIYYKFQMTCL